MRDETKHASGYEDTHRADGLIGKCLSPLNAKEQFDG